MVIDSLRSSTSTHLVIQHLLPLPPSLMTTHIFSNLLSSFSFSSFTTFFPERLPLKSSFKTQQCPSLLLRITQERIGLNERGRRAGLDCCGLALAWRWTALTGWGFVDCRKESGAGPNLVGAGVMVIVPGDAFPVPRRAWLDGSSVVGGFLST